jgi:nicotinamidase-related amidase
MKLDPSTTAIVLIEYQNEFTTKGGVLHDAVKGVMSETNMLANTAKLVNEARKRGVTIMHAPITFAPGYGELTRHPYGILKGAAICDELAPREGDIVIEGKRGLDTFASTNLDFILRSKGIKTVILGGFLTNCCVESTMRTAYEHGFDVVTLVDCVAGTSTEEHKNAIKYDYPMFSKPMPSSEVLAHLG